VIDVLAFSAASALSVNREIYRRLAARGWSIELVVPEGMESSGVSRAEGRGASDPPVHRLPLRGSSPRWWRQPGCRALLDDRRPRIVLLEADPGSLQALEIGTWCRSHGAALACQTVENMRRSFLEDLGKRRPARALKSAAVSVLHRCTARAVGSVFVVSEDGRRVMSDAGFERVAKIPIGFDDDLFRPDASQRALVRSRLGLTATTVAYFGRLVPEKGVHLLLEALARVDDPGWQLLLDRFSQYRHPYADLLSRRLVDEPFPARTVFFDAKHEEMPAYMNAADVVVVPSISTESWREQYGRVLPEAMACGRAALVSDSGALPEVAGGAALVFREGDAGDLAEKLSRLLASPELRRDLGARAQARAATSLSVSVQCDLMHHELSRWATPSGIAHPREEAAALVTETA
jgi:glycosyltransferase involved in cell wall biosynthesis